MTERTTNLGLMNPDSDIPVAATEKTSFPEPAPLPPEPLLVHDHWSAWVPEAGAFCVAEHEFAGGPLTEQRGWSSSVTNPIAEFPAVVEKVAVYVTG